MNEVLNYNIHDLIRFKIIRGKSRDNFRDLNLPFSFFETRSEVESPDITLNLGKFSPSNSNCFVIDHKYYIKNNYLYCKDIGGSASWEFEIHGLERGKTLVNFNGKLIGPEKFFYPDLIAQDILLRPLIEYKLNKKGYFLIHAAGISKGDRGYVFAGRGGSFKTSLCMDFIRKNGFNFLGDDKIILTPNAKILSFPVHLKAFEFKKTYLMNETFRNNTRNVGFFNFIKFLNFLKFTHYNKNYSTNNLFIGENPNLKNFIFINKTNRKSVKLQAKITTDAALKMAINNRADIIKGHTFMLYDYGQYFYKYILAYSFIFGKNNFLDYWINLEKGLKNLLSGVNIYTLDVPEYYNSEVFNCIKKFGVIK